MYPAKLNRYIVEAKDTSSEYSREFSKSFVERFINHHYFLFQGSSTSRNVILQNTDI